MEWINRILLAALLGCAVAFLPQQVYNFSGARSDDLERVLREQSKLEGDNSSLRDDIALLRAEIQALKHDPHELERIAREDLNLVHPAEIVFEVQREATGTKKPTKKPAKKPTAPAGGRP